MYSQCDSDHAGDLLVSSDREGTTLRQQADGGGSWPLLHQVAGGAQQTGDCPSHARMWRGGDVGCCLWPVPRPACCIL